MQKRIVDFNAQKNKKKNLIINPLMEKVRTSIQKSWKAKVSNTY
jgi:hypothetical protein